MLIVTCSLGTISRQGRNMRLARLSPLHPPAPQVKDLPISPAPQLAYELRDYSIQQVGGSGNNKCVRAAGGNKGMLSALNSFAA
jgi:hypothetical protein